MRVKVFVARIASLSTVSWRTVRGLQMVAEWFWIMVEWLWTALLIGMFNGRCRRGAGTGARHVSASLRVSMAAMALLVFLA
jgi:hypothetical protein